MKLSAGSGSGWIGAAEEPSEIKQRRTVYERASCKESVFGKMLAIETIALCAHYLQDIEALLLQLCNVPVCCKTCLSFHEI